ncbi:MAG: hypothetical protein ACOC44_17300 [Promethearchaeia archaeon]
MRLGLYLIQKVVERFNATIQVTDRIPGHPSSGAKFIVLFPEAKK